MIRWLRRFPTDCVGNRLLFYLDSKHHGLEQSFSDLRLPGRPSKRLNRLVVGGPALLLGLRQQHILHLYGATLLGSTNIAHLVPFVNVFPSLLSQAVPTFFI